MHLEPPSFEFRPEADSRRRLEEPLPVSLEAVADVHLHVPRSDRQPLDELYVRILQFAPLDSPELAYRADNLVLRFDLFLEDQRCDYRPVRVVVQSLSSLETMLAEAEIPYTRQKGLLPGHEVIVLQDSEGNWLEVREHREVG